MKSLSFFQQRRFLPMVIMGVVAAAIDVPVIISLAILIYAGEMAQFAPTAIGMVLFGAVVANLVISQVSSARGVVSGPQDSPAAILALMVAAIAAGVSSSSPETRFATAFAVTALTSIVTGLFYLLVGGFNLSRFIRFIPYPVVGGFIAGTGLLLSQGAFSVMTDITPGFGNLGEFFGADLLARWIPGTVFGVLLLIASRRYQHFLVAPVMLTGATAIFYAYVLISGQSMELIRAQGLLLGPFPQGALWQLFDLSLLSQVDWGVLFGQASNIGAVVVVSTVALLLNASALELIAKEDIHLNRELLAAGLANVVGGFGGSPVSYHYLSISALPMRTGTSSRWTGVVAGLTNLFVLAFGATLLGLIPKFMVGGLLLYLGLSFLIEWVYDAWRTLPRSDYFLVLLILGIVGGVGFLEGVGAGIVIAVILFAVTYSRLDFVKDTLTGQTYRSNLERPLEHRQIIQEQGDGIHILRLQGFLFFGTAQSLLNRIRERIHATNKPRLEFLILDFLRVSALDSSAAMSFIRLQQLAESNHIHLLFTALNPKIKKKLEQNGLIDEASDYIRVFHSLDHGMEWCENQILNADSRSAVIRAATLHGQLQQVFHSEQRVQRFMRYLERMEIEKGHILMKQGDPPEAMYLIETGEVTAELETEPGQFIRLRGMISGTVVGEIGMYIKNTRTATVIATQPGVVYRLTEKALRKMETDDPDLASRLHFWIVRLLAERLADNNRTLEALLS